MRVGRSQGWADFAMGDSSEGYQLGDIAKGLVQRIAGQPRAQPAASDPRVVQFGGGFKQSVPHHASAQEEEDVQPTPRDAERLKDQVGDLARDFVRKAGNTVRPFYEGAVELGVAALSPLQHASREGLRPPHLQQGHIEVATPATEKEWAECLRDLERTLQGDGLYIASQQRFSPVMAADRDRGDLGRAATAAAFDELQRALEHELMEQGHIATTDAEDVPTAVGGLTPKPKQKVRRRQPDTRLSETSESDDNRLMASALPELARRVAAHVSVGPSMQVALQNGLPPALWQPTFLLCVGGRQVRVMTFAFVGEPVGGDRPDGKYTPFVLRLVTEDLLPGAQKAAMGIPTPWRHSVKCVAELAAEGATAMLGHIASFEEDVFSACATGDWTALCGEDEPVEGTPESTTESFATGTYGLEGL